MSLCVCVCVCVWVCVCVCVCVCADKAINMRTYILYIHVTWTLMSNKLPSPPSVRLGKLNVGDQILVCDGFSMIDVTHDEAAQALKRAMDMDSVRGSGEGRGRGRGGRRERGGRVES